jgi:hypothetical protein
LATYGPEAVKMGDKCFATRTERRKGSHSGRALHSSSTKAQRGNNPE